MDAPAVKREAKEDCLFSASAEQLLIQHGRLLGGNAHVEGWRQLAGDYGSWAALLILRARHQEPCQTDLSARDTFDLGAHKRSPMLGRF
jgi:hypothetical protein